MIDEFNALQSNKPWTLVFAPLGRCLIGYKWAYQAKLHSDRSLEKYKACLVAKGFH